MSCLCLIGLCLDFTAGDKLQFEGLKIALTFTAAKAQENR